ncbi:MAG: Gfo/Idh/MocA family oxidoreductase [Phycisphaerales bacterium]
MVKLALIGTGGYAWELIKRIWMIPELCELVGVSHNPTRQTIGVKECKDKNIPVYDSVADLLDAMHGKADIIVVPTPIHMHFPISKQCLEAGFDIFLEKPPVATIQELDELNNIVFKTGKSCGVCFQYLYSSLVQRLKSEICDGKYGKIKTIKAMAGWPRLESYYSRAPWAGKLKIGKNWILDGTINNPLAHLLANQLYLASMKRTKMASPTSIQAELYHGHDIESEDTSSLRIMTEDNVEILFNTTLCSSTNLEGEMVIETEKAVIKYFCFNKVNIKYLDGSEEYIVDDSEPCVYMLERMIDAWTNKKPYIATLDVCRPFTLAVNGAFDSCGEIRNISQENIAHIKQNESIKTVIKGIDEILKTAHAKGKLFSECDVLWSKSSSLFSLQRYSQFPSTFLDKKIR